MIFRVLQHQSIELKSEQWESQIATAMLLCSPTMELGVISLLNAVYLRNVPPTPATRSTQVAQGALVAAVVVTYCASGSPHDRIERRNDMVAGVVRPPELDITNEELVKSHLHAVWLAEAKLALSPDIPELRPALR